MDNPTRLLFLMPMTTDYSPADFLKAIKLEFQALQGNSKNPENRQIVFESISETDIHYANQMIESEGFGLNILDLTSRLSPYYLVEDCLLFSVEIENSDNAIEQNVITFVQLFAVAEFEIQPPIFLGKFKLNPLDVIAKHRFICSKQHTGDCKDSDIFYFPIELKVVDHSAMASDVVLSELRLTNTLEYGISGLDLRLLNLHGFNKREFLDNGDRQLTYIVYMGSTKPHLMLGIQALVNRNTWQYFENSSWFPNAKSVTITLLGSSFTFNRTASED